MPLIRIAYSSPGKEAAGGPEIAAAANRLSADILHKDPKITAVTVEKLDADSWFIGDRSVSEHGLATFWLDIKIVESTNTKDEKARFIAEVFATMAKLLGPLHEESYVHVHDVNGYAYGYGGLTQEQRYIAKKLN
ncbi:MAG: tautomerase family protein [Pseudomonadota bacterium]